MSRITNTAGQAIIKDAESLRLVAYLCPAGKPTIGWGHTAGVKLGDVITEAKAQEYFEDDLDWCEDAVSRALKKPADDNQYGAMVSLCFNLGEAQFLSSSVLRLHNAGKFDEAAASFALWNKATVNGQLVVMPGLVIRRAREAALYMTKAYLTPPSQRDKPPMPQEVEPPKSLASSKTVAAGAVSVAAGAATVADQVTPAIEAVQNASTAAAGAATSLGAVKAALGSLIDGRALTVALSALALGCAVYFLVRYIRKARAGQVVST